MNVKMNIIWTKFQVFTFLSKLFFFSLLLLVALFVAPSEEEVIGSCGSEKSVQFDKCFARPFTIGGLNLTFPRNNRQLDTYCRESRQSIKCVKDFSKSCLTGMQKQSASLILYGLNKNVKHICTVMDKKNAAQAAVCFNKVLPDLNRFMDEFADEYRLVNKMESKFKVPGLCCGYYTFHTKLINRSSSVCNKDAIEYMQDFLNRAAGEMLDLMCANIKPGSEKCLNLKYPDRSSLNQTKSYTFIPPLMVVLNNL